MKPTFTLIMPVHKGQDPAVFELSLRSILCMDPAPLEFILVSDGEPVHLPDFARGRRVIERSTGKRSGPARARNLGAAEARGDILCFIDSDIIAPRDLIGRIGKIFSTAPHVDALFGSYDANPHMPDFLSQYRNLLHHFVHQTGREEAFTFWSGCGAIRREIFEAVGGFNGNRFPRPSIEDIELGYRLKKAGYSIRLCKDLQVKHLKKWEAITMIRVDFAQRALPWTKLLLEEGSLANDLNLKIKDRLSTATIFLLGICLAISLFNGYAGLLSSFLLFAFIYLNHRLYTFFINKKGWLFTARVIPWHGMFYLIGGLAFLTGTVQFYLSGTIQKQ